MHVRISEKGRKVLNNRNLASRIAGAIISGKGKFDSDGFVVVKNDKQESMGLVKLVTTLKQTTGSKIK